MKKFLAMALVLVMVLSLATVAFAEEEIDWRACEGGELMVYGGSDEEHVAAVCKAFEEKTGIKTSYIRLSGNDCFTRIKEERDNPQADVWYGGTWQKKVCCMHLKIAKELQIIAVKTMPLVIRTGLESILAGLDLSATVRSWKHVVLKFPNPGKI